MYNKNIIEGEILQDVKKDKDVDWQGKKVKTLELAESFNRIDLGLTGTERFYNKSKKVSECASYLEFKVFNESNERKLHRAFFCKDRLCPMCAWRRSLKIFGQVSKVMDVAEKTKKYKYLFLTLTCKNVEPSDLQSALDNMFNAFTKLTRRKAFKSSIKGHFRALEVTHNLDTNSKNFDTYHPHFHVVLAVDENYFINPREYISQQQWVELWRKCLKVDYTPIVDVRKFKSKKKKIGSAVAEAAKYTVKDSDYIVKNENGEIDEEMTDNSVLVLDIALAHRRLIAFGGELKEIHNLLKLDDAENGDLINTDNEELREDLNYIIQTYKWNNGLKNYYESK